MTSIFRDNSFDEFKSFIRERIPKKTQFVSSTGYASFDKRIPKMVDRGFISPHETTLVGEYSDLVFCIEIARFIDDNKETALDSIIMSAVDIYNHAIKFHISSDSYEYNFFDNTIATITSYVYGEDIELDRIIECAAILHKAQNYIHSITAGELFFSNFFGSTEKYIVDKVKLLVEVFRKKFLGSGIINKNSDVFCHPNFDPWGGLCGGAIADLYVDGTLYDFKSRDIMGYKWFDIAQLYSYYALNCLCGYSFETFGYKCGNIADKKIKSIALYYSRFGDIEKCDIENCDVSLSKETIISLGNMIVLHDKKSRANILDQHYMQLVKYSSFQNMGDSTKFAPKYKHGIVDYRVGDKVFSCYNGTGTVNRLITEDDHLFIDIQFDNKLTSTVYDSSKIELFNWNQVTQMKEKIFSEEYDFFKNCHKT